MSRKQLNAGMLTSAVLASIASLHGGTATAQSPDPAASAGGLEEVTVTARRREESIVDVPLAISVVSSEQLQKLDITTTNKLANYVPGLDFNDFTPGNSRNDRGANRQLIFRGLNVGGGGSVVAGGGMFLDGAAVVGAEVPAGLDIGAVEILRGPQSVYFGRSTMTGAVSYRTKAIPDDWKFSANIQAAERNTHSFEASVAGPIKAGILGMRLTGLTESSDGHVRNDYDGSTLGDRSRDSVSATLQFTPTQTIDVKLYANQFKDEDGAAATSFLPPSYSLTSPLACRRPGASRNTICGEVSDRSASVNYINTTIPANFANALFTIPLIANEGFSRQVGMQREVFNSHLTANFRITDALTLQWISGYHKNVTIQVNDGIDQPVSAFAQYNLYFYNLPYKARDVSHELRLTSDASKALSWTIGTNYVDAFNKGNAIVAFLNQRSGATTAAPGGTPLSPFTFTVFPQNLTTAGAKTNGYFGGVYWKVLDEKLTLSAEGRYQTDKRRDLQQNNALTVLTDLSAKFNSFNPRVSVDYDVGEGRKVYASYATGTRPGGFNGGLKTYYDRNDAALTAQLTQLLGLSSIAFDEEKLKMAEIGFKGYLGDGKGYFDVNAYSGKLTNQQVTSSVLIPLLGFSVGVTNNIGQTAIHGVEFQGNYKFTSALALSTTLSWNHAKREKFAFQGVPQFGTTILDGVKTAFVPEVTGSAVLSYDWATRGDWSAFTTGALVYRGKQYTDVANLSSIKGRMQLDLRAGVSRQNYRIEAFVANVFDNQDFTGGNVVTDFGGSGDANGYNSTRAYSFVGAWAPPRQFGVRVGIDF